MSLSDSHPLYDAKVSVWTLMRDSYAGEAQVKQKGATYLPPTGGHRADGYPNANSAGLEDYTAYKTRARYPGHVRQAVQTAIGMMHHNPPEIKLPDQLESMLKRATTDDESLDELLRRVNEQQLLTGRVGLLLDLPASPQDDDTPYIATYAAESVINWDDGSRDDLTKKTLNLVVLDETHYERKDDFGWEEEKQHRVLILGATRENERTGAYKVGVFEDDSLFSEDQMKTPVWRGNELDEIPFIFVNSCDLTTAPDDPPLLDLGNLCMTIYRGEADYRQNLFMQGQDTLVVIGGGSEADEAIRVGAGARIDVPMSGDAKYIGVKSEGLAEQRSALENDGKIAGSMGAQSLDTVSRERESGSSLQTRIAARTADLNQIALAGAKALENILKMAAKWVGADPEAVVVKPNLDFGDSTLTGQVLLDFQSAKNQGLPISGESLHQMMFDKGLTTKTFEEELVALKLEKDGPLDKADANGDVNPNQAPGGNGPLGKKEKTGTET